MFGLSTLSKTRRLVLGILVLIIVDIIWVASSELTQYLYNENKFEKAFFATYAKISMFTLYLSGFLVWKSWRDQCTKNGKAIIMSPCQQSETDIEQEKFMGDPIYVPLKYEDKSSDTECEETLNIQEKNRVRAVRFNNLSEVRQLSDEHAEDAVIARLSFAASLRAEEARIRALSKFSVKQVAKLAFFFCIMSFFSNYTYQIALVSTEAGVVNILSSTSGLFTLVCAAIYPGSAADRFTLSKLVAVIVSISGVVLVTISSENQDQRIPMGALWSLLSAILYALYLVSLRRKVDHEDKLELPMFFGFIGLFCGLLFWPGFFILHFTRVETFEWPNNYQWLILTINGIVGTVLSEILWLWGCFLTSSLIATLAMGLTIPLAVIADIILKGSSYSWVFYVGIIPVFASFFGVGILAHFENWDPVLLGVKKCIHCICSRIRTARYRDVDREQTESLIGSDSST
ncbi:hypothetical protein ACJMK2_023948 [Sinanodonta woodiana]|uniref:Solute carrier family 35 member F5 n=1 Tax=Sinanodonta woodiana TaxID=1069815 RepID=A0ABD3T7J6_SINWO